MNFQIILLPRDDYWAWVRACRDYVMKYGVNLTGNRETAAGYMNPRQVVTFPKSDRLDQHGDLEAWFEEHHPGVRLDPIEADSPNEMGQALAIRIEAEDRYGQRLRPFYLLWPTDYPMVTQKFGANPQIYTRFGMPGHEGLDIRALPNTDVYCCADGIVYRVHTNPDTHPYGVHIRVRHKDGYRTVYGHLAEPFVNPGDEVQAGEVIGKADSTGASTAAHLHLTLKRDGATARKETRYPKDVVDPTPLMVWPDSAGKKSMPTPSWSAGRCLIGVHGRLGGALDEHDIGLIQRARLEAVKVPMTEPIRSLDRLRSLRPSMLFVARLSAELGGEAVSPEEFVELVRADAARMYEKGVHYFEVLSGPNLHVEGWNRSWRSGMEFAEWFCTVVEVLRKELPEARFGFPGLSPGEALSGWRANEWVFLEQAEEAVTAADWVGVICHWTDARELSSVEGGLRYIQLRERFPDKLIFITECSNPAPDVSADVKARQYRDYFRMLRDQQGLGAAFVHPLAAARGFEGVAWRSEPEDGQTYAQILADRNF